MAYRPNRRLALPTMMASMITGGLAGVAFATQTYIGSPYGSLFSRSPPLQTSEIALFVGILFLPGVFFGFFAVWPLTLVAADWALRQEIAHPEFRRLHWPLAGALLGGPALLLYSFPLGLGQALLGQLAANGAAIGLVCASLTRLFIRPHIIDAAIGPNEK